MCNREPITDILLPRTVDHLSQFSASSDCGFFCGFVIGLLASNPAGWQTARVTREQVYQAREAHLQRTGAARLETHRHGDFLLPNEATRFLQRRGVSNYAMQRIALGPANFVEEVDLLMSRSGCHGVLIPHSRGEAGHWIAILDAPMSGPWKIYDPSGVGNTGLNMHPVPPDLLARSYARNAIENVIAPRG